MSFACTQDKRDLLAGMLFNMSAEVDLLQIKSRFRSREKTEVCVRQKFTSSQIQFCVCGNQ